MHSSQSYDASTRREILDVVSRFAADRVSASAAAIDRDCVFPRELYQEAASLGLLGLSVSEEYGGSGPDMLASFLALERIARQSVSFSISVSNCADCIAPIAQAADESLRHKFLPEIVAGKLIPSFCLTEASGGSDVGAMTTTARRDGDHYVLTGRKMWITNAIVADIFLVFAKTDPEAGAQGISAFLVSRDQKGLSVSPPEVLLGLRGSPTSEVIFDEVRIPEKMRVGDEGQGFSLAMTSLDEARLSIAAISLGAATAAIETALEYARERRQFGKPIIEHQGLQFLVVDLVLELASARSLFEKAVSVLADGPSRTAGVYAAMSKLQCSDLAMKAAVEAAQVLGANGLSAAYPIERLIRDCKALQIFEGTNQIQRVLIGRQLQRSGLMLDELAVDIMTRGAPRN